MAKCGACGKFLSAADSVRCNKCNGAFHRLCVLIPEKAATTTLWTCPGCKIKIPRVDNTSTPVKGLNSDQTAPVSPGRLDGTAQNTNEELKMDLALEIRSFRAELSALRAEVHECRVAITDLSELKAEVHEFRENIAGFKSTVSEFNAKITTAENRISVLENKMDGTMTTTAGVSGLEEAVTHLKSQLNDKDQELLSNDIDLSGIPEMKGESLISIIKTLSVKLGLELDERDIVRIDRVGSTLRNRTVKHDANGGTGSSGGGSTGDLVGQRPRTIAVRFARQCTRDQWLSAARVRRGLTSKDIEMPGPQSSIYVNERLTRINRNLFYQARQAAKQHKWKYVWSRNGKIFARKDDGQPALLLRQEQDIQKNLM